MNFKTAEYTTYTLAHINDRDMSAGYHSRVLSTLDKLGIARPTYEKPLVFASARAAYLVAQQILMNESRYWMGRTTPCQVEFIGERDRDNPTNFQIRGKRQGYRRINQAQFDRDPEKRITLTLHGEGFKQVVDGVRHCTHYAGYKFYAATLRYGRTKWFPVVPEELTIEIQEYVTHQVDVEE